MILEEAFLQRLREDPDDNGARLIFSDWLEEQGYTIAEAIERAGQDWVAIIPQVARQLAEEGL